MYNLFTIDKGMKIIYAAKDENEALTTFLNDLDKSGYELEHLNIEIFCMPLSETTKKEKILFIDSFSFEKKETTFENILKNVVKPMCICAKK